MAIIAPFRGLYYNPAKVPNLTEVVTPPYDVIRPAEREAFAARHPNNMVHLILPQALPGGRPARQPLHPGGGALPPMGKRRGVGAGSGAGALLLGDRVSACRAYLYPERPGGPGAPGAFERGRHQAPRADLFRGQGRPPGVVQGLPGQLLPHLFHLSRPRRPGGEPAARRRGPTPP